MNSVKKLQVVFYDGTEKNMTFYDEEQFNLELFGDCLISIHYDGNVFICNINNIDWISIDNYVESDLHPQTT